MVFARKFADGTYARHQPGLAHDTRCPWVLYTAEHVRVGAELTDAAVHDGRLVELEVPDSAPGSALRHAAAEIPSSVTATTPHRQPPAETSSPPVAVNEPEQHKPQLPAPRRFVPDDHCPADLDTVLAPDRSIWTRSDWDGDLALVDGWQALLTVTGGVVEVPVVALERYLPGRGDNLPG